jgi:hypothetical protein
VSAAEVSSLDRLLSFAPLSRLRQVVYAASARLHLVRFDRLRADRAQLRTLLGLVHRARQTAFGRAHDFHRIRSPEDFRRLVPLRDPAALVREYPEAGQTWPGARSTCGLAPGVFLSPDFIRGRRQALHTTLSLVLAAHPRADLLQGRVRWLGDGPATCFPWLVRPSLSLPVEPCSCLVGPASRIAAVLGQPCPNLTAVVFSRDDAHSVEKVRGLAGPGVLMLEMLQRPGAALAVEDPRFGGLRLLADHGACFEFVPADQAGQRQPPRLTLGEVRPGVPYEVAITSPAGWWACRSGLVVSFDRLEPPVIRVVGSVVPVTLPPLTLRGPHQRSAGTPAVRPGTSVHSPWSVPVDRE